MIILEKIQIEADKIKDVLCDACGKSCGDKLNLDFEYAALYSQWGYGSSRDGEILEKVYCENCTYEMIAFIENKNKL